MNKLGMRLDKAARRKVVRSYSVPSPISGINTRDPISAKDPLFAENLTNFICDPSGVKIREGWQQWATGLPGQVETVIPYEGAASGSDRLFAFADNSIYNVTSSGAVGAPMVTGLSNNRWSYVQQTGAAGYFLVVANGVDAVRHWNGTAWVTWTNVTTPAAPGEVGLTPSVTSLNYPITHQRRLWFVENNSTRCFYTIPAAIGGTLTAFDFGPVFPRGGRLVQLASWSFDASDTGVSSFLIAVSSQGDLAIYEGTDPSSATDWSWKGTWQLAAPTMGNCFMQLGGDTLYMSIEGLMPLSKYMQSTSTAVAITDAIRPTINELSVLQQGLTGFQLHRVPQRNLILINVPQIDPNQNVQFCMHVVTGGWTLFTGIPARCWANLNNETYFGGNGVVGKAFTGTRDNALVDGTGGDVYYASGQQAFNYFEDRATIKRFTLARPNLITENTNPSFLIDVTVDFDLSPPSSVGSSPPTSLSLWGLAIWGSALWSSGAATLNEWQVISGAGYCASVGFSISSQGNTTWVSTDIVFEQGGVIGT